MKRFYPVVLAVLLLGSCATYEAKYAEETTLVSRTETKEVSHTFYLIGDAGKSPIGGMNPALKAFKERLDKADKNSTAIFLGDNIYPSGFPDKDDDPDAYLEAKSHLDAQLKTLENFRGETVFIPGNHDWYSKGLKGLKRQENYIEEKLDSKEVFFPENGCPMETIEIGEDIVVIALDTEWFLVNWDKHPTINDECEIKDREQFFLELEDEIKDNRQRTTIIALHNPMFSYGSHGGQYSFRQHIFPTNGKVPLPVLGSLINILRRTSGASIADLQNKRYNELRKRVVTLAQKSEKVIFVSGHEHTLQYIVEENTPQIVSGSGAKKGATRLLNGSKFSSGQMGYAVLEVFKNGSSEVNFYTVDNGSKVPAFTSEVLPPDSEEKEFKATEEMPAFVTASVYSDEEVNKTGFFRTVWGERYRKYYATKVKAPTVSLDTLFGGLQPVRKGGGNQSKSLRLQHKDGRQFVMRALRKSAELYLQAIAFRDQYIVGDFDGTVTEAILKDFYTGAHPYAPFVIGALSDAVGLFHTNPTLYYIPKQSALGRFNSEFGDELYMIEEHVSEGHDDLESFGFAKKIESTTDFIEKLRKDEEYRLDKATYVRARLFDMMIGDWDRHTDQWRWAQFKQADGTKLFKPIPRDRDQAFSILGDGALMGFATRAVPSLQLFEGFQKEIRSVKGFNSSPRTFALDMALLAEVDLDTWLAQAKYIQENIDEESIDSAFEAFPEEVRDDTITEIKEILLARKEQLSKTAEGYFKVINKYSVVTGTDKDDHFVITPLPEGKLDVKGYRIKGGEKADVFFDRSYDPQFTREIWIYGLDDDDVMEVVGNRGKIKVRLIGGQNNDIYKIHKASKNVHVYDFKSKKNTYDEAFRGRLHKINNYETNTYQFLDIKASNNQFLPSLGFNPDDGINLGVTNTYTFNSFRRNPFTQRHTLTAGFYFATSGFDLKYSGEFAHVFEKVNLELAARFTSPNFAMNFFGFGNETPNFDDDLEFDFNRVKIRTLEFAPSLVWRGQLGSKVKLGVAYQNFEVEETEDRFIDGFFTDEGRDTQQQFLGVNAEYSYSNADDEAFPTMGMAFTLQGGYTANLDDSDRTFGYVIPSLSLAYKIASNGSVVLATEFKGHVNFGDDFEFYQGASIGANNGLRGFRFQRFTGKSAYFQNTDIRWSFRKRRTGLLPVTPGIYGGFDYGRVWFPDDNSTRWHNSYGGGFFANGAGILSASVGLFNSVDGLRFAFGFGFGF